MAEGTVVPVPVPRPLPPAGAGAKLIMGAMHKGKNESMCRECWSRKMT